MKTIKGNNAASYLVAWLPRQLRKKGESGLQGDQ